MISTVVNLDILGQVLTIGSWGLILGILLPWLFRLVGYLADVIFITIE